MAYKNIVQHIQQVMSAKDTDNGTIGQMQSAECRVHHQHSPIKITEICYCGQQENEWLQMEILV